MNGFYFAGSFAGNTFFNPTQFPNWVRQKGTTWQNFQDVDNWSVTSGSGSLTQEATGISHTQTAVAASVVAKTVTGTDLTGISSVTLEFEVDNSARISGIVVRYKTDNSNYRSFTFSTGTNSAVSTGFNRITMNESRGVTTGGSFSWANINQIEIRITCQTAVTRVVLRDLTHNQVNRPIAILELDDMYDGTYDTFLEFFSSRGLVGTLGVESASVTDPATSNKLSYSELKELYGAGWDFTGQCHATNANYSTLSSTQITDDIDLQVSTMKTALGITHTPVDLLKGWVYNGGNVSAAAKDILKSQYGCLHALGDTSQPNSCIGLQSHENRNYMEGRGYSLTSSTYTADAPHLPTALKDYVDAGVSDGSLMYFLAHAEGGAALDVDQPMFEALLDYLQTNNVEVLPHGVYISSLTVNSNGYVLDEASNRILQEDGLGCLIQE